MNPISVCLIAKNEERNVHNCLSSLSDLNAEIIIADTGSDDRTKEFCKQYTNKIYDFVWCDDFSAARNFAASKATNDWILVLDFDEKIQECNLASLLSFSIEHPQAVGQIKCRNQMKGNDGECFVGYLERFFNRNFYHYEEPIHEQVCRIDHKPIQVQQISLTIFHTGYALSDEKLQSKSNRNIFLLQKQLAKTPDNPYLYYQLGQCYYMVNDMQNACDYYAKGLTFDVDPELAYVSLMVINYGETLLATGQFEAALQFENIYDAFSYTADFVCLMGLIYVRNNMAAKALLQFMKALTIPKCWREGMNTTFPRYHIGLIYETLGNKKDAISFYQSCKDYLPAKKKLQELI